MGSLDATKKDVDVHEPSHASTKQPLTDLVKGNVLTDASSLPCSSRDHSAPSTSLPLRSRIVTLARPAITHMDFNIGAALWFAARGIGTLVNAQSLSSNEVVGSASASRVASPASNDPLPISSLRYADPASTTVTGGETPESMNVAISEAAASEAAVAAPMAAAHLRLCTPTLPFLPASASRSAI